MKFRQYLHFPKGNGSSAVAINLDRNSKLLEGIWSIGDPSSSIYLDGTFPVFGAHPLSSGQRFKDMTKDQFNYYRQLVGDGVRGSVADYSFALVHHGFVLADVLADQISTVSYLHGTEMLALQGGLPDYIADSIHLGVRKSDRILVMTNRQKLMAEDVFVNDLREDVKVVSGGFETRIYRPWDEKPNIFLNYGLNSNKKLLLFVGRLSKEKGIDLLLEMFEDMTFSKDKQLLVVGGGKDLEKYQEYVRNKGIDVNFVGQKPSLEVGYIMAAADVLIVPSTFESFGLVAIESIACGTPVVASNVGVLEDLISPGNGGFVFDRSGSNDIVIPRITDALDLALGLKRDSVLRYREDVIRKFSWEAVVEQLNDAIGKMK
jgi:glycosyltransferase involved in cell wall biosynthesis